MNLPPAIKFHGEGYDNEWAEYAALEAQRKGVIPRHISPRTVQKFFEELLPVEDEEDETHEDDLNALNASIIEDLEEDAITPATATTATATPTTTTTTRTQKSKSRFSNAQYEHICQYRSRIDNMNCDEFFKDWKNVHLKKLLIGPKRSKIKPEDYYVRASAVWLPHIIIPNHIPCCPLCKSNGSVDIERACWVDSPMLCYSRPLPTYLDTKRYPCNKCKKMFRGTDIKSMELDRTGVVRAVFRFRLLKPMNPNQK